MSANQETMLMSCIDNRETHMPSPTLARRKLLRKEGIQRWKIVNTHILDRRKNKMTVKIIYLNGAFELMRDVKEIKKNECSYIIIQRNGFKRELDQRLTLEVKFW